MKSPRAVLGMPAFHLLVGCFFSLAFVWPFIAFNRPITVFCFLMGAWAVSIAVAFVLSKGQEGAAPDDGPDEYGTDFDV